MINIKNQQIIVPVVVAVVVGGAAFFGGMQYQKMQRGQMGQSGNRQFQLGQGGNRQGGPGGQNRFNGGAVMGEILSVDDKSITVKLQDGSSKIVLLPDTATVSKNDTGSKTDLKVGEKVGVFGATNSDGSVTAQNVQLNPMFRMGPGGSPSASPR